MNIDVLAMIDSRTGGPISHLIAQIKPYVFEQRFYVIFSFLFGVGFYLFLSRAEQKNANGHLMFFRRLVVLAFFGAIHQLVQPGEALLPYAIFGFILWPFYSMRPKWILISSFVFMAAGIGYFYMLNTLAMFLLGLWAGKTRIFENLSVHLHGLRRIGIISLIAIPAAIYLQYKFYTTEHFDRLTALAGLVMGVFYVSAFIQILQAPFFKKMLKPLQYMGRMSLTNYIGQTLIIIAFLRLTGMYGHITHAQAVILCICTLAIQAFISAFWLRAFRMGPLEWMWRIATYWKRAPLKSTAKGGYHDRHADC
ncbi:DUF418 domain-containing protein [Bacillus paralicheniformis]|uniref:DUF418 domain-containing protein n=2 Tax=Bacillus paralicheniformis TaxID=1648923 RepID=UPI003BEEBE2C